MEHLIKNEHLGSAPVSKIHEIQILSLHMKMEKCIVNVQSSVKVIDIMLTRSHLCVHFWVWGSFALELLAVFLWCQAVS